MEMASTRILPIRGDARGSLIAIEAGTDIPFEIKRIYYIFDTKIGVVRGKHAHKLLKQVLISVSGSCTITLDDGKSKREFVLNSPDKSLFIGPLVWREMKDFSPGAVLLVIASEHYQESDYIFNYDEFKKAVATKGNL